MGEWRVKKLSGTVRAIVFDLDDTLYPEVQYVRSGFRVARVPV
jgi:FMN phosphatase YigB (HAD superfamily)